MVPRELIWLAGILIVLMLFFGFGPASTAPMGINVCYAQTATTCKTQEYRGQSASVLYFYDGRLAPDYPVMSFPTMDDCRITAVNVCEDRFGPQGGCSNCYYGTWCEDRIIQGTIEGDMCVPDEPPPSVGSWRGPNAIMLSGNYEGWYEVEISGTVAGQCVDSGYYPEPVGTMNCEPVQVGAKMCYDCVEKTPQPRNIFDVLIGWIQNFISGFMSIFGR